MGIDSSLIERCISVACKFGAKRLILFGSAAEAPESARDLDIACDGVEGWKLFELGAKIEEEIGMPVDIVPLQPVNRFTQYIAKRGRVIYEALRFERRDWY
jgi:predicted nucleotidyltransferase